ncbi:MAG: hypothetical protein OIF58_03165 [Cohaesibacter sp.]|nr:hypothetical protein [Cohaesibacter sp.]
MLHTQSARLKTSGLLFSLSLILFASNHALAQSNSKPMNLGTILQKQTQGAPPPRSYVKLPKQLPAPKAKAISTSAPTTEEQAASTAPEAQTQANEGATTAPQSQAPTEIQAQTPEATNAQATQTQPQASQAQSAKAPEIQPGGIARLQLAAFLTQNGQPLQRGMNWRIFEEKKGDNGRMPMTHNSDGGALEVDLKPGRYIVYAGYGYANLTKRVILPKAGDYSESFILQAGGLRLGAVAAGDINLDNNLLRFNIYSKTGTEENQQLIAPNIRSNQVIKLTEGTYHIVSSYGDANAKVRGDVEVKAGDLVTVTMIHNAAKITLRLVSEPGGEALTNTVWTVLTPGGDLVKRAIGAFPTLALAAGDYTAIAKQGEEIYNRDFAVDAGLNRDIEVLASQP